MNLADEVLRFNVDLSLFRKSSIDYVENNLYTCSFLTRQDLLITLLFCQY